MKVLVDLKHIIIYIKKFYKVIFDFLEYNKMMGNTINYLDKNLL